MFAYLNKSLAPFDTSALANTAIDLQQAKQLQQREAWDKALPTLVGVRLFTQVARAVGDASLRLAKRTFSIPVLSRPNGRIKLVKGSRYQNDYKTRLVHGEVCDALTELFQGTYDPNEGSTAQSHVSLSKMGNAEQADVEVSNFVANALCSASRAHWQEHGDDDRQRKMQPAACLNKNFAVKTGCISSTSKTWWDTSTKETLWLPSRVMLDIVEGKLNSSMAEVVVFAAVFNQFYNTLVRANSQAEAQLFIDNACVPGVFDNAKRQPLGPIAFLRRSAAIVQGSLVVCRRDRFSGDNGAGYDAFLEELLYCLKEPTFTLVFVCAEIDLKDLPQMSDVLLPLKKQKSRGGYLAQLLGRSVTAVNTLQRLQIDNDQVAAKRGINSAVQDVFRKSLSDMKFCAVFLTPHNVLLSPAVLPRASHIFVPQNKRPLTNDLQEVLWESIPSNILFGASLFAAKPNLPRSSEPSLTDNSSNRSES